MTIIAIASVLAILLVILIVRITRDDIVEFKEAYVDFLKAIPTRTTLEDAKADFIHAGKTLVKAFGQIGRALKLVGLWLALPLAVVLLPIVATAVMIVEAYRK